jgi:hypothetical protein
MKSFMCEWNKLSKKKHIVEFALNYNLTMVNIP